MTTEPRKRPELVIGLVGILAAGLFLVWMLKSGMSLPFGLHNPFAKPAQQWADAAPDQKTAAKSVIQQQLDAFDRKDYQAVTNVMSARADPILYGTSHYAMMAFRLFPHGALYQQPVFGAITSDTKTGELLVRVTIRNAGGDKREYEYRLVKEQGAYLILSFHYPDNKIPVDQRNG